MVERRLEPRIESRTSVVMIPLATVSTRLQAFAVNVSTCGIRVHSNTLVNDLPRAGEVYRVQSGDDVMLCEVRHCQLAGEGADLGFKIVYWANTGELHRLVQGDSRSLGRNSNPAHGTHRRPSDSRVGDVPSTAGSRLRKLAGSWLRG